MNAKKASSRVDFRVVADLVKPNSRVLDIGCSDGKLLELLASSKNIAGRGIELSQDGVNICVARGLSVIQGDADTDLEDYPDDIFDYVILSQTLQAVKSPRGVLEEMLRIGQKTIVSFPNFGNIQNRLQILFKGRMPVTNYLSYSWYETPNIHFCTILDFLELCSDISATVEDAVAFQVNGKKIPATMPWWYWNLFGEQAVFLLSRKQQQFDR